MPGRPSSGAVWVVFCSGISAVRLRTHPRKGESAVPDVMVWITKPADEEVPGMERLGEELRRLDHVSEPVPEARSRQRLVLEVPNKEVEHGGAKHLAVRREEGPERE